MSAVAELTLVTPDPQVEFLSLFQNAPFGLLRCQQGNVTDLNRAMERILGDRPGASSHSLSDLIHAPEGERLISELLGRQRVSFQVDDTTASASGNLVRWTAWRTAAGKGTADNVIALAEEIPAAEQRLRQAERLEMIGRLAGGVAHDFNNLLTGVLLYCDLLMAGLDPGNRARRYAEEIRNAGLQASALVRQLLTVAKPTHSEPRLLSLNEIAQGMRNLLMRLIGENIQLELRLDADLGLIKMDPAQAQQILLNLVLNARDAMPAGGQITIETSDCKVQVLTNAEQHSGSKPTLRCALFVVADTGKGMDAATRAHLFEAFFTTKDGKGTGLGLATVHDIVTSHGGLIYVDSEPDRGTRISVLLPLAPEVSASPREGPTIFHPGSLGNPPLFKKEEQQP